MAYRGRQRKVGVAHAREKSNGQRTNGQTPFTVSAIPFSRWNDVQRLNGERFWKRFFDVYCIFKVHKNVSMEVSVCRELDQPPPLVHFWLQPCFSHFLNLSFFHSVIVSFCHSLILSFCHSVILQFQRTWIRFLCLSGTSLNNLLPNQV